MKFSKYLNTIIFALIFLSFISGCLTHRYQSGTVTSTAAYPAIIERAKKDKRYFIMYSGINIYSVVSVQVDKAKEHMTVQLDKVDSARLTNNTIADTVGYNSGKGKPLTTSIIHLYTKDSTSYTLDEPHTIPLANVAKIEMQK
jgi:hypothetical protein